MSRYVRGAQTWTLDGLTVIGIVANPKTNEPALVVTDGEYVSLRSLAAEYLLERLGRGYYEENRTEPFDITRLPRCHTPDGVKQKGRGWGTSLYTALCLGAYAKNTYDIEISMYGQGDGVSSWTYNRSSEADTWWTAAVRVGLADQETTEETETEENVDLELSPSQLSKYVDDGEVVYVNKVSVDIEKTTEKTVEKYPYDNAYSKHLIGAEMRVNVDDAASAEKAVEFLWRAVAEDGDLVMAVDPVALLAFDVRKLGREGMNLLSLCCEMAEGIDGDMISQMWRRNELGLDPVPQMTGRRLAETRNGMSDVVEARREAGWEELAELP